MGGIRYFGPLALALGLAGVGLQAQTQQPLPDAPSAKRTPQPLPIRPLAPIAVQHIPPPGLIVLAIGGRGSIRLVLAIRLISAEHFLKAS